MPDLAELNLVIKSSQVTQANNELKIFIELGGKVEAVSKNITQVTNNHNSVMGGLSNTYSKLQGILTAVVAGVGAVGLAMKAVQLAGQQEQRLIGFTTLLKDGDAAKKMLADLRDFANSTPFEFPDLAKTAKTMLAYGMEAKDIIPILRDVGDAASSLGGGADMMDSIVLALGQMQQKGKIAGQEMLQLANVGVPAWRYLADMLGTTIPAAQAKVERGEVDVTKALMAFREGMRRDFGGGMEAQSKTLLGIWSNMKDEITTALTEIGETIVEVFGLKGKLGSAVTAMHTYGAVVSDTLRILAGMPTKHKEIADTAQKWATVLREVGAIMLVVFGALMLENMVQMVIKLAQMVKFFATMSATAAPLLTIVLAVGVALGAWAIGKTLYDQFETLQVWLENIRHTVVLVQNQLAGAAAAAAAPAVNMTVGMISGPLSMISGIKSKQAPPLKSIDGGAVTQGLNAYEDTIHKGTLAQIQADAAAGKIGGNSFGDNFAKNIKGTLAGFSDEVYKAVADLGGFKDAVKDSNTALEDLTKTKKAGLAVDKARGDSATDYIDNLKKEQDFLKESNILQKYYNDLHDLGNKLNGEYHGDKAKIDERLNAAKVAINEYETAKLTKGIQEEQAASQRELNILATTYGTTREAALATEKQIGKAQADGIHLSQDYIDKLTLQNKRLVEQQQQVARIDEAAKTIGDSFANAFTDGITGVKSFGQAAISVMKDVEKAVLKAFITQPLSEGIAGYAKTALSGFSSYFAASGGATAHAAGGWMDSPTYFKESNGRLGLGGEAGRERIVPEAQYNQLQQTARNNQGSAQRNITIVQHITTPDADSFRRSKRQIAQDFKRSM